MIDGLTVQEAAKLAPIASLAANLLKPLAESAWKWTIDQKDQLKFQLLGGFETYLENAYSRHSYLASIVFRNEQRLLENIYVPLTISKPDHTYATKITSYPTKLFDEMRRVLIVDTAGMGKSTLTKFIFLACVRELKAIPILIELRKLSKSVGVTDLILQHLTPLAEEAPREQLIFDLLQQGRFLLILDGFDEIAEADRAHVTDYLVHFIERAPQNSFLLTSREETGLSSFPDFQRFYICPLTQEEAFSLINKYDPEQKCAHSLIEQLKNPENSGVLDYLTNPLLTSLLFSAFEYKKKIPLRKHIFYRQVFEALFERHDLMKEEYQREKRSGLDIDEFDELLRHLCFVMYKDNKMEVSKDELLKYVDGAKRMTLRTNISSSDFIHDLTHGVPLMVEEGLVFRWAHRSIQEYFAASWICRDSKDKQEEILIKLWSRVRHQNIISLCADIDGIEFRRAVVRKIAKLLIDDYEKHFTNHRIDNTRNISARMSVVAGRLPFIADFPEASTLDEDDQNRFQVINTMINEYCKKLGHKSSATHWTNAGQYCIGYIDRPETVLLDHVPSMRVYFSFIETCIIPPRDQLPVINFSGVNGNIFYPIEDDLNHPLNSQENFNAVTEWLDICCGWKFNYEAAVNELKAINAQEHEASDLASFD